MFSMEEQIEKIKQTQGRNFVSGQAIFIHPSLWRNIPKCVVDGCNILFDFKTKVEERQRKVDNQFA